MAAPHGAGVDADSVAAKVAWAKQQAAERKAAPDAATLVEEEAEDQPANSEALDALERVMMSAPDAASKGLEQAWQSVSAAGTEAPESAADDAAVAAPIDVPAGPPSDVPAGPPAEHPDGPPDGVPPADAGRP